MNVNTKLKKALKKFIKYSPFKSGLDIAIILGSGLGEYDFNFLDDKSEIPFSKIPFLKTSKVKGHKSKFLFGKYKNKNLVFQCGRLHLYENYSLFNIGLPVAIYGELKTKYIIITNAAGGINENFNVGDIMMIEDHINFQGINILSEFFLKPEFVDMTKPYYIEHYEVLSKQYNIKRGTYIGVRGPSYETPAEIRAFKSLGADAVGMSTVQEVILANYYKIKTIGLSLITNKASGLSSSLSHEDVINTGIKSKETFFSIIKKLIELLN